MKNNKFLFLLTLSLLPNTNSETLVAKTVKEGSTLCIEATANKEAKSYWQASYKKDFLRLDINVIDENIFSVSNPNYSDGVYFYLGSDDSDIKIKVIASSNNDLLVYKKTGDEYVEIDSKVTLEYNKAIMSVNRFKGYTLTIRIPYTEIGLNNQSAYNSIRIAPYFINADDYTNVVIGKYTTYKEDDVSTYLAINKDNTILSNRTSEYLFAGDTYFDNNYWTDFFYDMSYFDANIIGKEKTSIDSLNSIYNRVLNYSPSSIVLSLGNNEVSMGYDVNRVETAYNNLFSKINEFSSDANIYILSLMPSSKNAKNLTTIKTINTYLSSYCDGKKNYTFIDAYNYFVTNTTINEYYYESDGINLNRFGYTKLSDVIYRTFGLYTTYGQTFGNTHNGLLKATKGLEFRNDRDTSGSTLICNNYGEQYAYYNQKLKAKFSFDVCFDLDSYKNEASAGIFIQDLNNTLYFYFNPATKEVGFKTRLMQREFLGSCKETCNIDIHNVRLTLLKKDEQILMYLNGNYIYSYNAENFFTSENFIGVMFNNTKGEAFNYKYKVVSYNE